MPAQLRPSLRALAAAATLVAALLVLPCAAVPPAAAQAPASPGRPTAAAGAAGAAATPTPNEPPAVGREFRAAWVSPVRGMGRGEWPSAPGLSADEQRAELRALLDCARDAGLNAVVLHVRTAGDALYPTPLAPWSAFLSGASGVAPSPAYDPLAFAVEEAHARGLQLHAWFNPFRAMLPNFAGAAASSHVTRAHRDWVRPYGTQTWIDPGIPAARRAVLATIVDVVRRYDVDGVHIDDYFYPYRETETVTRRVGRGRRARTVTIRREIPFPDGASWRRYGRARGWTDRDAWRRANTDALVRDLYKAVKAEKPWVLVGLSPFGIWRPGAPAGVTGLDAYNEIYADSRRWLREGWADYMAPQLYWSLDGAQNRFRALDAWWRSQNTRGRHVWPGLNTARVGPSWDAWPPSEITAQVAALRRVREGTAESAGHVHFRLGAVCGGYGAVATALRTTLYDQPALVPAAPWLGARKPAAPSIAPASVAAGNDPPALRVAAGDATPVAWWLVQTRGAGGAWATRLVRASPADTLLPLDATARPAELAVTAISRSGVAGAVARVPWPDRLAAASNRDSGAVR